MINYSITTSKLLLDSKLFFSSRMFDNDDENDGVIGAYCIFFYFSALEYSESYCLRQQGKQ